MKVMKILNLDRQTSNPEEDRRLKKIVDEYRERVLGKTCVHSTEKEYWEIKLAEELGMGHSQFKAMDIDDRAKLMAHHYLSDMVRTIDRHYEEQEANRKKAAGEKKK